MAEGKIIITATNNTKEGFDSIKKDVSGLNTTLSGISKNLKGAFTFTAITAGVTALVKSLEGCVSEFVEAERVALRFDKTFENVKGSLRTTAGELSIYADNLEQATFFTAEAVLEAGQLLAATGKLTDEGLYRAIDASADLAEAMGQDITSAASQLARALQDPESGLRSLRSAGISFNDEQEALIKNLIESGRELEAQDIILKEVEKRYQGVAKAVADTPMGTLDAIKDTWGALKEDIGGGIVDMLGPVFDWVLDKLTAIKWALQGDEIAEDIKLILKAGEIADSSQKAVVQNVLNRIEQEAKASVAYLEEDYNYLEEFIKEKLAIKTPSGYYVYNESRMAPKEGDVLYDQYQLLKTSLGLNNIELSLTSDGKLETKLEDIIARHLEGISQTYGIEDYYDYTLLSGLIRQFDRDTTPTYEEQASLTDTEVDNESLENVAESLDDVLSEIQRAIGGTDKGRELQILTELDNVYALYEKLLTLDVENKDDLITGLEEAFFKLVSELEELTNTSILPTIEVNEGTSTTGLTSKDGTYNFANINTQNLAALSQAERLKNAKAEAAAYKAQLDAEKEAAEKNKPYNYANINTQNLANIARAEYMRGLYAEAEKAMADRKAATAPDTSELDKILELFKTTSYGRENTLLEEKALIEGYIESAEEYEAKTAEETLLQSQILLGLEEILADIDEEIEGIRAERGKEPATDPNSLPEPTFWENLGNEFNSIWADFSEPVNSVAQLTDSLTGGFGSLLSAMGPLTDIIFSTNPLLTMLAEIIDSFVSTLAPMITTVLAPITDTLRLIGSTLANLFIPIFNALYPAIHSVAQIITQALIPVFDLLAMLLNTIAPILSAISGIVGMVADAFQWLYEPVAWIGDLFGYVGEVLSTFATNVGVLLHNITHWFSPKEYEAYISYEDYKKQREQAREDAYNQYPTLDYSTQLATQNASYTGGNTITINIFQQAPVVGDGGMSEFALMIRDKFEELDYFGR